MVSINDGNASLKMEQIINDYKLVLFELLYSHVYNKIVKIEYLTDFICYKKLKMNCAKHLFNLFAFQL